MRNVLTLPAFARDGRTHVVVETPKGSGLKIKFDPVLQCFILSRALQRGLVYPYDWGFIPSTCAPDGDPLDALVVHETKTASGLVLLCEPIGILEVMQQENGKKFRNDRVFFSLCDAKDECAFSDIAQLPAGWKSEMESFFNAAVEKTEKKLRFLGWHGPARARRAIDQAAKRYAKKWEVS